VRTKLERKDGAFNLGRFELPVAIAALAWLLASAFVSIVSAPSLVPILIVVGMLLVGGVYLAYLMTFRRQVLEREPGAAEAAAGHGVGPTTAPPLPSTGGSTVSSTTPAAPTPPSNGTTGSTRAATHDQCPRTSRTP